MYGEIWMEWVNIKTPIIAPMNQKGGVGKTLFAGLLAEWFGLVRHMKVLLIDLDMQCNTSDQWVGMDVAMNEVGSMLPPLHKDYAPEWNVNERSSIADMYYGKSVLPYESWLNEQVGQGGYVDVMCGHPRHLEEINTTFSKTAEQIDAKIHHALRVFLADEMIQTSYDVIIIDTGPSRNPIFRSAMRAASHVLIPFRPETKDIQGISAMLQIIRHENYYRPTEKDKLQLVGLFPNQIRKTKLHETNLAKFIESHPEKTAPQHAWINLLTAFPERDRKGIRPKSVFELEKDNPARKQATTLAEFVESKVFNRSKEGEDYLSNNVAMTT